MKFNRILIIVIIAMVAFTAINMFMTYNNQLKIETLSYNSVYTYDNEGKVIMESDMDILFLKPAQMEDFLAQFDRSNQEKLADFQKSLDSFAEKLERTIVVENFESVAVVTGDDTMRVEENSVVSGFAVANGDEINTSLSDTKLDLEGDSSLTIIIPDDAEVISVSPEPTSRPNDYTFIWTGVGQITFPEVKYIVGN